MLQVVPTYTTLGIVLMIVGALILLLGLMLRNQRGQTTEGYEEHRSRGIILIGPIPIVWGFGTKGRIVALVALAVAIIVWLMLFL